MIVKSNKTRAWGIGTKTNETISIIPGPNTLTNEQFDLIKDHPDFKIALEKKEVELLTKETKKDAPKNEDNGEDSQEGIGGLGVKDAKALIEETFNTAELKSWLESETRKTVKEAIEKQLEKIEEERKGDDSYDQE